MKILSWQRILPMLFALALIQDANAQSGGLKRAESLSAAFWMEVGTSEFRLIRWPVAPNVYLVSTSPVPDSDRMLAEEVIREIKGRCACIGRIDVVSARKAPKNVDDGNIVLILDRGGFAALHNEAPSLMSWAFPSEDAREEAQPDILATGSALDFRFARNGAVITRGAVAVSTQGEPLAIRSLSRQGLLLALSPTLSQIDSGAVYYMEKQDGGAGTQWVISAAGYEYLTLLYNRRLKPGMTSAEVETTLRQ